jgi:hypothetical protein
MSLVLSKKCGLFQRLTMRHGTCASCRREVACRVSANKSLRRKVLRKLLYIRGVFNSGDKVYLYCRLQKTSDRCGLWHAFLIEGRVVGFHAERYIHDFEALSYSFSLLLTFYQQLVSVLNHAMDQKE